MKSVSHLLAASLLALSACTSVPASSPALQDTASLMVSITQHGEGASTEDIADLAAQLDEKIAAAPDDPFVLKLAAIARTNLAEISQDRAQRVKLRHEALDQFDRAISVSKPETPSRIVKLNGQDTEVDLKDLPDLRAQLFHTVQTDR